jgi:nicotinic acid mononucleotide adenylyltransferase
MVELAVANPVLLRRLLSLKELDLHTRSTRFRYFLSTLRPAALAFIVGVDAFRELSSWKEYETIPPSAISS